MDIESGKLAANDIFAVFEKHKRGECSYDRALEDAAKEIHKYCNSRPLAGYIKSGNIRDILSEVYSSKKQNEEKNYMFDCKVHQNEMDMIERILKVI